MNLWKFKAFILIILCCLQVNFVRCLICYVCTNQKGNVDKCLNTWQTCAPGKDVCGTEIRWGSLPYFSLGALKQYYVSKRCMSKRECQAKRKRHMPYCTHIWYEDWSCHDCCQGDLCNYYVISGSKRLTHVSSTLLWTTILILPLAFLRK